MANFRIVTNNPAVTGEYGSVAQYVNGGVEKVFSTVRDAVHLGAVLISHPLAGSLKPNVSPYRSVVLSTARGPVDLASLAIIEDAVSVLQRLPVKARRYGPRVLEDFQSVDMDLVRSAMCALPAVYHQHTDQPEEVLHANGL